MNVPAFVRPATAVGKDPFYFTRGGCDIRELLSAKVTGELLSCIISICAMNNAKSLRIDPLVIAIRAQLGHMRSSGEAPVSAIDLALGELDATGELPAFPIQEPLPACRHLVEIDASPRVAGASTSQLLDSFMACWPAVTWRQNENYRHVPEMQAYLADSAYGELVGPHGGMIQNQQVSMGFLIIGPQVNYPSHKHPAHEIYSVVSGVGHWWRYGEPWTPREPGATVYHGSGQAHGIRTVEQPLLAFYLWVGDIDPLPVAS